MWQNDKSPEAAGRLDNLKELVRALAEFESLGGFLEHVSLVMDNDEAVTDDKITLMTLHAAKGLEFDTVFLPGWEEGLFPHQRALDEGGTAGLEEERRLAYVGLTRARKRAFIFYTANRQVYGYWQSVLPSRFIKELPEENVEREAPLGLNGTRGSRSFEASDRTATAFAGSQWQSHARRSVPLIDAVSYQVTPRHGPDQAFETGQRVFHQKFGYGRVVAVNGDKLDIQFEKAGAKKVIQSFVEAV
jgi:DNA helicase-2/ATP-dependent DNA helicase PcrA